ncbi:archaellin/type IV pilin N-terminal domain-containing protein [Halorarum salinum]|uniref:Flagellin n=1 Tax=Halorarum salinum TaxID=2743089 RepID=A0A7D5Q8I8_9EURY|nr:archaellin/type IV pilin N-terminal domain-containing protein [Halobaculum salinum]QLG61016.1 flagellin [Halobaculum salinum]
MFEFITDEEERGQVGIGTLIVFIAMVLVAAIAAGVLINTAGFLQSSAQETGEQSSSQVSDRLQEVDTTGNVSGSVVDKVNITVTQAAGAGEIDLRNVTVNWVGPDGTYTIVHDSVGDGATSADSNFSVTELKDADDSSPVLNDPDDRLKMTFDLGDGNKPDELGEGEEVTIKVNTMSGATTTIRFTVPQSLDGKQGVEL